MANLEKAEADFKRDSELFKRHLLSESDFIGFKVARDVAKAQLESANDQVNVSKANVDNAQDQLNKTTLVSPLDGTITRTFQVKVAKHDAQLRRVAKRPNRARHARILTRWKLTFVGFFRHCSSSESPLNRVAKAMPQR